MRTVSVITPMGRERPDLWAPTAESISRAASNLPDGWQLKWCVHLDGIDASLLAEQPWWPELAGITTVSSAERLGIAVARNLALAAADGELIGACDDDDRLADGWPNLVAALAAADRLGWAVGATCDIDLDGEVTHPGSRLESRLVPAGEVAAGYLADGGWPWHCCAFVARTGLVRGAGGWSALPWAEDLALWVDVTSRADGVQLTEVVYEWRKHPERTTHSGLRERVLDVSLAAVRGRAEALLAAAHGG